MDRFVAYRDCIEPSKDFFTQTMSAAEEKELAITKKFS
jgi:hypothetical protein